MPTSSGSLLREHCNRIIMKETQMKSIKMDCAPETILNNWISINWTKVKQSVKSLQLRIAKAIKQGKHNKAKAMQWLLAHSFYAKQLAVKRVT